MVSSPPPLVDGSICWEIPPNGIAAQQRALPWLKMKEGGIFRKYVACLSPNSATITMEAFCEGTLRKRRCWKNGPNILILKVLIPF
jgi:hypothetical protein